MVDPGNAGRPGCVAGRSGPGWRDLADCDQADIAGEFATPAHEPRPADERQPRCIGPGGSLRRRPGPSQVARRAPSAETTLLIWLAALLIAFAAIGLAMPAGH